MAILGGFRRGSGPHTSETAILGGEWLPFSPWRLRVSKQKVQNQNQQNLAHELREEKNTS